MMKCFKNILFDPMQDIDNQLFIIFNIHNYDYVNDI